MSHISLYRKYRSQDFDEIIGQDPIVSTLKNAINNSRIAHAYLFTGPRGTGKTSTARIFAKALNCSDRKKANPCGKCDQCIKITRGNAINVFEIDAASNRGIDDIRELRDKIAYKPVEGIYKIYIIDEVHMLSPEAFNALLKTLEEPPSDTVFILATTEPQKVPVTISSRCQRFDFGRISAENIVKHLKEISAAEKIKIEDEALDSIARASEGSLRDALSLIDQLSSYCGDTIKLENVTEVLGTSEPQFLFDLGKAVLEGSEKKAVSLVDKAILEGVAVPQLTKDLLWHFRNLLLTKIGSTEILEIPKNQVEALKADSAKVPLSRLKEIVKKLSSADAEMKWHRSLRMLLEMTLIELCTGTEAVPEVSVHKTAEKPVAQETGGGLISSIKAGWGEILEKMKSKSPFGYVSLHEAEPLELDKNGRLIISFKKGYSFHKSRIEDPKNKVLLEECVSGVAGRNISVSCIMSEVKAPSQKTEIPAAVSVADIEELFDGTVVS
ncbi:MAG: DNA polymerase III subunit gamma/tau [Candidatus Margulisiibacteriota bacterium]